MAKGIGGVFMFKNSIICNAEVESKIDRGRPSKASLNNRRPLLAETTQALMR